MVSKGRGNFLKVKCLDCDNEQIIFDRAASDVKCIICGKTLVKSRGAKAKIMAHIDKVLNQIQSKFFNLAYYFFYFFLNFYFIFGDYMVRKNQEWPDEGELTSIQ